MNAALLLALLAAADGGAPDAAASDAAGEGAPAACVGSSLDLDTIFAGKACDVPGVPQPAPAPAALAVELAPKRLSVTAGKTARVTVSFRNLTDAPLPLDLDMSCGLEAVFETALYRGARRADLPQDCGIGRACGRRTVRVTLAPRGVARVHVPVSATAAVIDETCMPKGRKPIAPGGYDLVVSLPLEDRVADSNGVQIRTARGRLTVVGLARLPGP
ncbi:MAG TPA: hypothetical protein VIF57_14105 [Polyangia bacterium]|jgi:hypothetical protein